MCGRGRDLYEGLNQEHRLRTGFVTEAGNRRNVNTDEAVANLATRISETDKGDIALLISAQYTNEEYEALLDYFVGQLGVKNVYQWREPTEKRDEFDGILLRGDRNANTAGLASALKEAGLGGEVKDQFEDPAKSGAKLVIALAPQVLDGFPSFEEQLGKLAELEFVSYWGLSNKVSDANGIKHGIPMKGFAEKSGSFTNFEGKVGSLADPFPAASDEARDVSEVVLAVKEVVSRLAF